MRPGFGQFNVSTDEYLRFAAQFGATDVPLNAPLIPGDGWIAVTISTMLVATMVPAAVLAWRWTDAPADLD